MTHIPLPSIDMHRKLNAKRLLTFGIIVMLTLTSFAVLTSRPARACEPFWFLPSKWHFTTGTGSFREMIVCASPADDASGVPPVSHIPTIGANASNFDLEISEPDEHGNATITVPKDSISIPLFYIRIIKYSIVTIYLWGNITATADGYGTLDTVGGNLKVDVFNTISDYDDPGRDPPNYYKIRNEITDNVTGPSRVGDSLVYLPLQINAYSGTSETDPTKKSGVNIYDPMPLLVTTGFTRTVINDTSPHPSGSSSMNGYQMNATGVPADPYTGGYTGVTTLGNLDLYARVIIVDVFSDSIFSEVMVSEPVPAIPSQPIIDVKPSPEEVSQGGTVSINVTVKNGLASSATADITVYANETEVGTQNVNLDANENTTLTFTWDTTGAPLGKYQMTAELDGEIDGTIYTFSDSYKKIPGDIDGNCDVDADDYYVFSGAYGTNPASNPACDLDGDGDVDADDYYIFAGNYGKSLAVVVI